MGSSIFPLRHGPLISIMAMSGAKLTSQGMETYNEIQKAKKHRYAIFLIKDGDGEDCRYGLYDYEYQFNPDGAESTFKSKIFLMCWCPDNARIKKKMVYSSSFDTLKRAFVGVHKVIQANGQDECTKEYVEEVLRATDRN